MHTRRTIVMSAAAAAFMLLLAGCNPQTITATHIDGGCFSPVVRHWLATYTGPSAANIYVTVGSDPEQRLGWVNPNQQFTVHTWAMGGCPNPSAPQTETQVNIQVRAVSNTGAVVGDLSASGTKDCWPGDVTCLTQVPNVNSGPSPA